MVVLNLGIPSEEINPRFPGYLIIDKFGKDNIPGDPNKYIRELEVCEVAQKLVCTCKETEWYKLMQSCDITVYPPGQHISWCDGCDCVELTGIRPSGYYGQLVVLLEDLKFAASQARQKKKS